jgi:hypothetical protein
MTSLHIEHSITDLATWLAAFSAFAEVRKQAGVTAETVRHPVGDDSFIVIDLEFGTADEARAFQTFLETQVWAVRENSPALAGRPVTKILEAVVATAMLDT